MQDIISSRLASHSLDRFEFATPQEVVRHYGCMQAQDIGQALWVIGSRIEHSTESLIIEACRNGSIVRTWPMRGTLHYMDPRNVKWMLELCASKTLPGFAKRRAYLGISDEHAEKSLEIIQKELEGGYALTRTELGKVLEKNGIPMQTQWVYHLSCYAATRGIICFGPPTEKEETFVLLDEWIKDSRIFSHDEQLMELARMYIRGHGGATADDLAWWCGLSKTECKKAISLIENELEKIEYNGKIYYYFPNTPKQVESSIRLIGGFDEYFLAYKDRSIVADTEHHEKLFTTNGIFFPIILRDGRAVGSWKRSFKKDKILINITLLPGIILDQEELKSECERYTSFMGYEKYEIL